MNNNKQVYLGDGLYVSFDGYQFVLVAPRKNNERHWVALEPNVLRSFLDFVGHVTASKVSVTPLNQET